MAAVRDIQEGERGRLLSSKQVMNGASIFVDEEVEAAAESARRARVDAFGVSLRMKRSAAINARTSSGVERRWMADDDNYHGRDSWAKAADLMDSLSSGPQAQSPDKKQARRRSTQFVQKTRQKTNTASAHACDLLFPTDDRNWRLRPTPVPKLMDALKNNSNDAYIDPESRRVLPHPTEPRNLTTGDMVIEAMKAASDKCEAMQTEIDDQLVECNYNAEGRKAIHDATKLGTGIMRGPIVITRTLKKWVKRTGPDGKTFYEAEITLDKRPASNRVDPWNAYPAPGCGDSIHHGGYFWEKELCSPADLRDLAKVDGFDTKAILECMKEKPARAREAESSQRTEGSGAYLDSSSLDTTNYEIWLYWGEADAEDLEAMGVSVDDEMRMQTIGAAVVMCNDRVIKAQLNPSDFGEIPYDFFVWEPMTGSPWGVGVPYLMRYAQAAMNAAWRQMQDNAGITHGPQILLDRRYVEPANKDWELHGMKMWYAKGDLADTSQAIRVFQVENNQEPLERIFQIANELADDETAMPMLMQGDQGEAPDKVGVARILVNGASVMLKRYARNWDDGVTAPHLKRYYNYNMQYSKREDIKGDYEVQPLGSTHLVVKDQKAQDIANTAAMASNPMFAPYINPKKLAQEQVRSTAIPSVLYSDEELAENEKKKQGQPPPEEPSIAVAKIRAEAAVAAEKVEAQSEIANQQLRAQEAARNDERELAKLQLMRDLEILKMGNAMQMSVDKIKAQLAGEIIKQNANAQQQRVKGNQELTRQAQRDMGRFPARSSQSQKRAPQ